MMECYGIMWSALECSGTFSCKLVYIDLNHTSKGQSVHPTRTAAHPLLRENHQQLSLHLD
jgi:hypothetical protein